MTDSLNNKELVAVGHELAKALSTDTPIIDIAKILTRLAERLDCTTAALREKGKQCDALAAENAGMKSGIGFFSYDSSGCYEEHDTAEKAVAYAEDSISEYRDNAPDGWSDEVGSVVWGVIMQRATMTGLRPVNCTKMVGLYDDLNDHYAPPEVVRELARIALASLEAEPASVSLKLAKLFRKITNSGIDTEGNAHVVLSPAETLTINEARIALTAPPAPVSDEDLLHMAASAIDDLLSNKDRSGAGVWADVPAKLRRAAMLQGKAEPRNDIRREHAEWSQSTFGDVGPVGPLKHLSKEALEAAAEPDDLSEWADMQFLFWDAQRRAGITDEQITQAMIEKLAVNKARQWPEPKDGEPRLHITPAPQQGV